MIGAGNGAEASISRNLEETMANYIPTRIGFARDPKGGTVSHQHPYYSWDLRYYGWLDRLEERRFQQWAFGSFDTVEGCHAFIVFLLQRPVATYLDRSAQFHIFEPLSAPEKELVDTYIEHVWQMLPTFLQLQRRRRIRQRRVSQKRKKIS